jgi:hypothetical protein
MEAFLVRYIGIGGSGRKSGKDAPRVRLRKIGRRARIRPPAGAPDPWQGGKKCRKWNAEQ